MISTTMLYVLGVGFLGALTSMAARKAKLLNATNYIQFMKYTSAIAMIAASFFALKFAFRGVVNSAKISKKVVMTASSVVKSAASEYSYLRQVGALKGLSSQLKELPSKIKNKLPQTSSKSLPPNASNEMSLDCKTSLKIIHGQNLHVSLYSSATPGAVSSISPNNLQDYIISEQGINTFISLLHSFNMTNSGTEVLMDIIDRDIQYISNTDLYDTMLRSLIANGETGLIRTNLEKYTNALMLVLDKAREAHGQDSISFLLTLYKNGATSIMIHAFNSFGTISFGNQEVSPPIDQIRLTITNNPILLNNDDETTNGDSNRNTTFPDDNFASFDD